MYMYSRIVNEIVTTYEPQILEKSKFFRQQVKIFVKSSVRGSLACTSVTLCRWHRCVFGFDHFWNGGATACERAAANFVVALHTVYPLRAFAERIPLFQKWLNPNTQRRHRHNATDVQASDQSTDDFTKIFTCWRKNFDFSRIWGS